LLLRWDDGVTAGTMADRSDTGGGHYASGLGDYQRQTGAVMHLQVTMADAVEQGLHELRGRPRRRQAQEVRGEAGSECQRDHQRCDHGLDFPAEKSVCGRMRSVPAAWPSTAPIFARCAAVSAAASSAAPREIADTIASFREILEGKADELPEQAFFLAGTLDDVRANAVALNK
jgi:hypothetical protein